MFLFDSFPCISYPVVSCCFSYLKKYGFDNAEIVQAVTTDTIIVVSHKKKGLFYYAPDEKEWFSVGVEGPVNKPLLETSFAIAAGSNIVLASIGTKVGYLHHGESKEDGTMDFHECKSWWDFAEIAPGVSKIAAMDVSGEWVCILVEIPGATDEVEEENDVKFGVAEGLEVARAAEGGV